MFSLLKSPKSLVIAAVLLMSSTAQPAFAFLCTTNPDYTPEQCAVQCAVDAMFTLAYLMCY